MRPRVALALETLLTLVGSSHPEVSSRCLLLAALLASIDGDVVDGMCRDSAAAHLRSHVVGARRSLRAQAADSRGPRGFVAHHLARYHFAAVVGRVVIDTAVADEQDEQAERQRVAEEAAADGAASPAEGAAAAAEAGAAATAAGGEQLTDAATALLVAVAELATPVAAGAGAAADDEDVDAGSLAQLPCPVLAAAASAEQDAAAEDARLLREAHARAVEAVGDALVRGVARCPTFAAAVAASPIRAAVVEVVSRAAGNDQLAAASRATLEAVADAVAEK